MANHKLVVKNTLFLYFRVFISMAIGLYTSRMVLYELGVKDFGIYSVVGSLTMLFAYMNFGISSSLQRFMSCEIAVDNQKGLQKCFSTSLVAAVYLGLILIFIAETVGLWVLKNFIEIPAVKEADAIFVFQFSIIILIIDLFKTCCTSLIVAEEKMSFFAYISICESLLKLLIVFLLIWTPGDKLRIYSLLLAGVSVVVLGMYIAYCKFKFPQVRFSLRGGHERLKEISSFTGWNTVASMADLSYMQGTNVILNVFYGVAYNATLGIANQVKNALYSFSKNLQMAANPHLTKEFAQGDYTSFSHLSFMISVISYMLLFLFGLPILLNTEFILNVWLTTIPPDCTKFVRLVIIFCLIDSLVGPLWVGMQAYGKIRNYQIIMSAGWFLSLPIMWLVLVMGASPSSVLVVQICINAVLLTIRIWFATRYCHINAKEYIRDVICRILATTVLASILPIMVYIFTDGFTRFYVSTATAFVTIPISVLAIAFNKNQRHIVLDYIKKKIGHGRFK